MKHYFMKLLIITSTILCIAIISNCSKSSETADKKKVKVEDEKTLYVRYCPKDGINIRTGPGINYAKDESGPLQKGDYLRVVEEKGDWIRFQISPEHSGWVNKDLVVTANEWASIKKTEQEKTKTVSKTTKKKVEINRSRLSVSNIEILEFHLRPPEYGYTYIVGELKNNHTFALGVKLQAVARDKQGKIIQVLEFWPASVSNIPASSTWPFEHAFDRENVASATIRVINVRVWD